MSPTLTCRIQTHIGIHQTNKQSLINSPSENSFLAVVGNHNSVVAFVLKVIDIFLKIYITYVCKRHCKCLGLDVYEKDVRLQFPEDVSSHEKEQSALYLYQLCDFPQNHTK